MASKLLNVINAGFAMARNIYIIGSHFSFSKVKLYTNNGILHAFYLRNRKGYFSFEFVKTLFDFRAACV